MAFPSWTPLWNKIVDSSIWEESPVVRVVWVTMLALKDSDHIVRYNAYGIAKRSNLEEKQVLEALQILSSPDKKRLEKQENDGIRIKPVDDGWLILKSEFYQKLVRKEMKKAADRRRIAEKRAEIKLHIHPAAEPLDSNTE